MWVVVSSRQVVAGVNKARVAGHRRRVHVCACARAHVCMCACAHEEPEARLTCILSASPDLLRAGALIWRISSRFPGILRAGAAARAAPPLRQRGPCAGPVPRALRGGALAVRRAAARGRGGGCAAADTHYARGAAAGAAAASLPLPVRRVLPRRRSRRGERPARRAPRAGLAAAAVMSVCYVDGRQSER